MAAMVGSLRALLLLAALAACSTCTAAIRRATLVVLYNASSFYKACTLLHRLLLTACCQRQMMPLSQLSSQTVTLAKCTQAAIERASASTCSSSKRVKPGKRPPVDRHP